jgi:hypothetical protein
MRDTALIVLGCHDPDFASQFRRDPFEDRQTGRFDAIIVDQQYAVEHASPPASQFRVVPLSIGRLRNRDGE